MAWTMPSSINQILLILPLGKGRSLFTGVTRHMYHPLQMNAKFSTVGIPNNPGHPSLSARGGHALGFTPERHPYRVDGIPLSTPRVGHTLATLPRLGGELPIWCHRRLECWSWTIGAHHPETLTNPLIRVPLPSSPHTKQGPWSREGELYNSPPPSKRVVPMLHPETTENIDSLTSRNLR